MPRSVARNFSRSCVSYRVDTLAQSGKSAQCYCCAKGNWLLPGGWRADKAAGTISLVEQFTFLEHNSTPPAETRQEIQCEEVFYFRLSFRFSYCRGFQPNADTAGDAGQTSTGWSSAGNGKQ